MDAIIYCDFNHDIATYIALSHNLTYKISNPHGAYFTIRLNNNNQSRIHLVFLLYCTTECLICYWLALQSYWLRFTRI